LSLSQSGRLIVPTRHVDEFVPEIREFNVRSLHFEETRPTHAATRVHPGKQNTTPLKEFVRQWGRVDQLFSKGFILFAWVDSCGEPEHVPRKYLRACQRCSCSPCLVLHQSDRACGFQEHKTPKDRLLAIKTWTRKKEGVLIVGFMPLHAPLPSDKPFLPLSSEHGTYKTVKARFWLWLSGESP